MATIIAGNQNKIPPELDASYRDICINANGHKITLSLSGSNITANGIAFAHGVVGYYKNEIINDASNNGYVYVTLTTNQDEDVEDSTEIFFSSVVLTELTPNISTIAGTYRMLVATITDGSITYQNKVEYPKYAVNADVAERVTGTIASNTKATTQPTTDRSTKVSTTAFVKNAIESQMQSGELGSFHQNISSQTSTVLKRLGLVAIRLEFTVSGSVFSDGIPTGQTIAVIPEWARPSQSVIKTTADNRTFSIGTNGSIVETTSGSGGYVGGSSNIIDFWYLA